MDSCDFSSIETGDGVRRNWSQHGKIQRIFVDAVIKTELCKYSKSVEDYRDYSEVLRSLRPYQNHADHLHVRLYCPPDAQECIAQEEVPAGPGC